MQEYRTEYCLKDDSEAFYEDDKVDVHGNVRIIGTIAVITADRVYIDAENGTRVFVNIDSIRKVKRLWNYQSIMMNGLLRIKRIM